MLPVLVGSTLALGFALVSSLVYGPEALVSDTWVVLTLFGLFAGPAMMALADRPRARPRSRRRRTPA
jgi:hypothetical protein